MNFSLGIFFGSDTGNTENVARIVKEELKYKNVNIFDIAESNKNDLEQHDKLLFGIPTWYYGEPQCDWDDFFPILKTIDFSGKQIALFGCGDQEDYSEYFCDAMSNIKDIILPRGANIVGYYPTEGYHFESSKSLVNVDNFIGLAIDEDRQPELTLKRIKNWTEKLRYEMNLE